MTKSWKHCGKRRNCSSWAISSFVTMFSKSCLLQRRQKASIWGKGCLCFIRIVPSFHVSSHTSILMIYNMACLYKTMLQLRTSWNWQIYRSRSAPFRSVQLRSRSNQFLKHSVNQMIVIALFRSVQIERFCFFRSKVVLRSNFVPLRLSISWWS